MTLNHPTNSEEAAKREGYIQGRSDENVRQRFFRRRARMVDGVQVQDSTGTGMVFGLIIAGLAALIGGLFYVASSDRSDVVPVAVPQLEEVTPDIEVPDVQVTIPDVEIPDVNITTETVTEPVAE